MTETEEPPEAVEAESMPMPRLQIDQPREMQPLPPSFEVGFGVESAAPDEFRRLFKHGHVCFELTISPSESSRTIDRRAVLGRVRECAEALVRRSGRWVLHFERLAPPSR